MPGELAPEKEFNSDTGPNRSVAHSVSVRDASGCHGVYHGFTGNLVVHPSKWLLRPVLSLSRVSTGWAPQL